jgi:hypothetical protein
MALLTGVGVIAPSVGIGYNPNRRIDVAGRAALIHDNVPSGSKRRFNCDVGSTVVAAVIYEFVSAPVILIIQRIQKEDVRRSAKTYVNKLQGTRRYHVVQKLHICPVYSDAGVPSPGAVFRARIFFNTRPRSLGILHHIVKHIKPATSVTTTRLVRTWDIRSDLGCDNDEVIQVLPPNARRAIVRSSKTDAAPPVSKIRSSSSETSIDDDFLHGSVSDCWLLFFRHDRSFRQIDTTIDALLSVNCKVANTEERKRYFAFAVRFLVWAWWEF